MFLRRLLKWTVIVLVVLAVGLTAFVWGGLGVNPFEGRQEHLWDLVSNEVHFFLRAPGVQVLDEPVARNLETRPGFEPLARMRSDLEQLTRDVAREVNPQVPLGLFEVDVAGDFGREFALAGTIDDHQQLKLSNFLFMVRVPWYGRFISALKRGFVRSRMPDSDRIEVLKGLYLKVRLDPAQLAQLNRHRALRGGAPLEDHVYVARIKDVLLVSDSDVWIEDAIRRGREVLPADAYFESEFIRTWQGPDRLELFLRIHLSGNLMVTHGREGPLAALAAIMPPKMCGDITLRADPQGAETVAVTMSNVPPSDGFPGIAPHLRQIYEYPKSDPRVELGSNGIGRFIPRDRTVAALLVRARAEDIVDLGLTFVPPEERQLLDQEVRKQSGARFVDYRRFLVHLTEDLADTHLVILHRPSLFERVGFEEYRPAEWVPAGQLSFSIVSRVKDSVPPDEVRVKLFKHLRYLGMDATGTDESGKFHTAEMRDVLTGMELVEPAYGAMTGDQRFFVFSTSREAAAAVFRAAENPDDALASDPNYTGMIEALAGDATVAGFVLADGVHGALRDRVRQHADIVMDAPRWRGEFAARWEREHGERPSEEVINREMDAYFFGEYPLVREQYEESLEWLRAFDSAAFSMALGVTGEKKVTGRAVVRLAGGGE